MRLTKLSASPSCSNSLARTMLGSSKYDVPQQGKLCKLEAHITNIAGGATKFNKLTIGQLDNDRRYIVSTSTASWEVDAADATKATLVLKFDPPVEFLITDTEQADTAKFTGLWIGHQLDAGTCGAEFLLTVEM